MRSADHIYRVFQQGRGGEGRFPGAPGARERGMDLSAFSRRNFTVTEWVESILTERREGE
jgi:hypothetical protein